MKTRAVELMQYRNPVGFGPSGNTWPRCASHRRHSTSGRTARGPLSGSRRMFFGDGRVETGPSGARIVFRVREEEIVPATDAPVDTLLTGIDVLPGKWLFGSFLPGHHVLLELQYPLPLRIRFHHFPDRDELLLFHGIHLDGFLHSASLRARLLCGFRERGSLPAGTRTEEKRPSDGQTELEEVGPFHRLPRKRSHFPFSDSLTGGVLPFQIPFRGVRLPAAGQAGVTETVSLWRMHPDRI